MEYAWVVVLHQMDRFFALLDLGEWLVVTTRLRSRERQVFALFHTLGFGRGVQCLWVGFFIGSRRGLLFTWGRLILFRWRLFFSFLLSYCRLGFSYYLRVLLWWWFFFTWAWFVTFGLNLRSRFWSWRFFLLNNHRFFFGAWLFFWATLYWFLLRGCFRSWLLSRFGLRWLFLRWAFLLFTTWGRFNCLFILRWFGLGLGFLHCFLSNE